MAKNFKNLRQHSRLPAAEEGERHGEAKKIDFNFVAQKLNAAEMPIDQLRATLRSSS